MPGCGVGRRAPKFWAPGNASDLFRQVDVVASPVVALFNDLPREIMGPTSSLDRYLLVWKHDGEEQ